MQQRQQRTLVAFQNVLGFLKEHPLRPEPPLLASMRRSLEATTHRIQALSNSQLQATLDISGDVRERVKELRRLYMMPLARVAARRLAYSGDAERALRVPHARDDAFTVATAALRMADALIPHQRLLSSAGCSREFLREFRRKARELALTSRTAMKARQRRTDATSSLAKEFEKGMETLLVIEGLIMMHGGNVSEWKQTRKVRRPIGRPRKKRRSPVPRPLDSLTS
ncbi:MAG TPA: hypothetical protein VJ867_16815 [Gemmatimonadaceae bacterium]|nr:hypothetical protein [Gemmatimonadaceae bacterium]